MKNDMQIFSYKSEEKKKKVHVTFLKLDFCSDEYINLILSLSKKSKVLIILNSIRRSQKLYKKIKSCIEKKNLNIDIGLLHSKFVCSERGKIEEKWIKKYGKNEDFKKYSSILVGTQILEQSLDIDSCYLFTDLCPIDYLLQRMGRLWRFDIDRYAKCPKVFIFVPGEINKKLWKENVDKYEWNGIIPLVYLDYYVIKTYNLIKNRKYLTPSEESRKLINKVYSHSEKEKKWLKEYYSKVKTEYQKEIDEAKIQLTRIINIDEEDEVQLTQDDDVSLKEDAHAKTRLIKQAGCKFVLLNNITENEKNTSFKLDLLDGESIIIDESDFDEKISDSEKFKKKKIIWESLEDNAVQITFDRFKSGFDIKKILRNTYKGTILEHFFGKYLFLLIVDKNRNLININKKDAECDFLYYDELGLYNKKDKLKDELNRR